MQVRWHNWQAISRSEPILRCWFYLFTLHICQNCLLSGMWLVLWHLMLASANNSIQGPSQYRFQCSDPLHISPPPPCHTFVMLSLSLRGHTVTLFTGSHAGVKCVSPHFSFLKSLWPHANQIWKWLSELWNAHPHSLSCYLGPNWASNLSINVHLCI